MKKVLSILTLVFATAIVASESKRDTPLSGRSTAVPTSSCEELSAITHSSFKPLQDKRVLSIANIMPEELDEIFNRSPSPANIARFTGSPAILKMARVSATLINDNAIYRAIETGNLDLLSGFRRIVNNNKGFSLAKWVVSPRSNGQVSVRYNLKSIGMEFNISSQDAEYTNDAFLRSIENTVEIFKKDYKMQDSGLVRLSLIKPEDAYHVAKNGNTDLIENYKLFIPKNLSPSQQVIAGYYGLVNGNHGALIDIDAPTTEDIKKSIAAGNAVVRRGLMPTFNPETFVRANIK